MIDLSDSDRGIISRHRFARACRELSAGRPVVACDSADPTAAYLVCAADRIDTATMAFVIRHTSGLIDVVLSSRRCGDLGLVAMSGCAVGGAGRRVSVDAAEAIGTGISAADRAYTARVLAHPRSSFVSLTRPGHVGTIAADDDAALVSRSTLDCTLELVRTQEICATVVAQSVSSTDPTCMAMGREVMTFSRRHSLAVVTRGDIVTSRLRELVNDMRDDHASMTS